MTAPTSRDLDLPDGWNISEAPERWYVVEQAGRVLSFADGEDASRAAVAIDICGRVDDGSNEAGLLGLAFHPD